ncbi:iron(III) transport system substrate-binding protein [Loktanella ponticola]|uniref:Iron(III) transport system substrate-binding protein n=1 Tax=Yoonia ponticola TaxID=1524255 RepID=A0A7W9EYG9_9RHOB|nr:ABC transporter substrate-binding protein [Yoonia ponticola]MBB5722752.1 iron(III) transport system substrate-binding protein [Yoonia ponticola]
MRHIIIAAGLTLWASIAGAYEIEEEAVFEGGEAELSILSTTDTEVFAPLIAAFQASNPGVTLRYTVATSQQVFAALQEDAAFDLAISSAMDLQLKLANDGFAVPHASTETAALPDWARWRDQLFAFSQEPVVIIASKAAFDGKPPRTRAELIDVLRDDPARFVGRIGTYDPMISGAGYLFATQDARQSDTSWRLAEVVGGLNPKLFTTSGSMISEVQSGELALAYNVLGSYASQRLSGGDAVMIEALDFTHVLLRTALIPRTAERADLGATFLDFLLSAEGQQLVENETGMPRINEAALAAGPHLRPIRLDPGLLVFMDPLMRQQFLNEWTAAVVQD